MHAAVLLPLPDGPAFSPVEIELSGIGDGAEELNDISCTNFGLKARPAFFLRRLRTAGAGSSSTSAGADTAAPDQYKFVMVSSAAAAQHILQYSQLMDPDNPSVDQDGNPAVWVRLPEPADTCSRPAAAASPAAAAAGGTQSSNAHQQQSGSGGQQATSKTGRNSSRLDWQATGRDIVSLVVLKVYDEEADRVQFVTPATQFKLSAQDGESTENMSAHALELHHASWTGKVRLSDPIDGLYDIEVSIV